MWYPLLASIFIICCTACLFYNIFSDCSKSFKEYLIPELKKHRLRYKTSTYYKPKFMDWPFDFMEEDAKINPLGVGGGIASFNVHMHFRKVVFMDRNGKEYEAIASVEFKDRPVKTFKRVRWKPELPTFNANKE